MGADYLSRLQRLREDCSRRESEVGDQSFYSVDYYRERERTERSLAEQAASAAIRSIHLEMAERYRQLADQADIPLGTQSPA